MYVLPTLNVVGAVIEYGMAERRDARSPSPEVREVFKRLLNLMGAYDSYLLRRGYERAAEDRSPEAVATRLQKTVKRLSAEARLATCLSW